MKKKNVILVTGLGKEYLELAIKMINSLKKTNPELDKTCDIALYTQEDAIRHGFTMLPNDLKMRYMIPIFAKELLDKYECVARLDSDMIITGDISSCFEGDFDVAVVQNANPREIQSQMQMMGKTVQVWDIDALKEYVNCGFVVIKSKEFVDHWLSLCTKKRANVYQFYEQDFLNILCYYGNYKVRFLDKEKDNKWWGLIVKQYTAEIILKDKKLILPAKSGTEQDMWPEDSKDKEIIVYHVAGGNSNVPNKFADLDTRFKPEVASYLKFLISDDKKA